jgi:hypothetical protein
VVHSQQRIANDARVKLRLTTQTELDGMAIPTNTFVYGKASFQGDRVLITINSIGLNGKTLPVNWKVYDTDGGEGIYIPGLLINEGAKEGADQVLSEASTLNVPYLKNAPLNALRNRNSRLSAILTDGYRVTLK